MKTVLAVSSAGLIAATIFTTSALAQVGVDVSGSVSGGVGVGADVGGITVGAEPSGNASGHTAAGGGTGEIGVNGDTATGLAASTTAATDAKANLGQAISSIQASKTTAVDIGAATDVTAVNVVSIDSLAAGEGKAALDKAIDDNADAVAALRSSIGSNTALSAALQGASVDLSSVVAATVNADGGVTVYTR